MIKVLEFETTVLPLGPCNTKTKDVDTMAERFDWSKVTQMKHVKLLRRCSMNYTRLSKLNET